MQWWSQCCNGPNWRPCRKDSGHSLSGWQAERGGLCQRRCERLRDAQAAGKPSAEVLPGNLEFRGGWEASGVHRQEGMPLCDGGISMAQHRLSAPTTRSGDDQSQGMAEAQAPPTKREDP